MASTIAAGTTSGTAIAIAGDTSGVLQLQTNGTTAAVTIDTSQNVGIGTSSPTVKLDAVVTGNSLNSIVAARNTTSGTAAGSQILVGNDSSSDLLVLRALSSTYTSSGVNTANGSLIRAGGAGGMTLASTDGSGIINFTTGGTTERMRIDASGRVGIGKTPGTAKLDIAQENDAYAPPAIRVNNVADDFSDIQVDIRSSAGYINGTNGKFIQCYSNNGTTTKAFIRGDGTYGSATNTYGSTSDIKLKTDIVDAGSQWDDIKAIKVRKYKKIDEPTLVQIGVIAQEIELVSPKLVDEELDYEEIDYEDEQGNVVRKRQATGTTTKSVKYSILYMKAVKALQEAMERIETIEAKVEAQAVRIAELEGAK